MKNMSKKKRILFGLIDVLFVLIMGYLVIRPIHLRWGANDAELTGAMPGDLPGARWTRAITIQATPTQIWPWLLQWGQGRGGWYSYDWLENLLGFDIHTAKTILPEYQNLRVGDPICMAKGICPSQVTLIEPEQWLSWQALDEKGNPVWSFTFGLSAIDDQSTRLVVRESFDPQAMPTAMTTVIEIPDVVMEQKALETLKQRAEGTADSPFIPFLEISLWLAALILGITAAVLTLRQESWLPPLGVGLLSVITLLVLTFLFPPLWLRALLDLILFLGLLGVRRYNQTLQAEFKDQGL